MTLESINLRNFRSYTQKEFNFSSGTTLVVGPNAVGKTNLLEAIYLLSTGKSFRAGVEREMISYGEEIARLNALVAHPNFGSASDSARKIPSELTGQDRKTSRQNLSDSSRQEEKINLEVVLTTGQLGGDQVPKKKFLVNGVSRRLMDFVGNLNCVLFRPEDLEIIIDSPSVRRHYLDAVLEGVDREYRRASLSYQKGLRQRNRLLEQIREEGKPRSILYFWDKLLIENGNLITQKREEFIDFVNQQPDYFGDLQLEYDQSLISPQRLDQYAQEEVAAGITLVGPHRDNFVITQMNADEEQICADKNSGEPRKGRDLSVYGSRGEQRTAIFSLKLAELAFVARKTATGSHAPTPSSARGGLYGVAGKTGQTPVLLLDDIFSELDHQHRQRLLEVIPHQQTIITTTDLHLIEPEQRKEMEIIELE